jgi:hypothetical protein
VFKITAKMTEPQGELNDYWNKNAAVSFVHNASSLAISSTGSIRGSSSEFASFPQCYSGAMCDIPPLLRI